MAASIKLLFAAGAAFVGGVATTVALMTVDGGHAPATPKGPEAEVRSGPSGGADRKWADPVKPAASVMASSQAPSASLTFDRDEVRADIGVERRKLGGDGGVADGQSQRVRTGAQAADKLPTAQPQQIAVDRARADRAEPARPVRAHLGAARTDRNRAEQPRLARLNDVETDDASTSSVPNRALRPRQSIVAAPGPSRDATTLRLAADRNARMVVMPVRAVKYTETQPREAREPRRRVSTANTGGVMKWLMEPGGSF